METVSVKTPRRECFVDVTSAVARSLASSGVREGLCHVFVAHTT
ncbi:MAG: YjbQ family protein, partial [Deltaproteobacteria bacterium]|nr:YjbQ family protein [Deltaproteobacteria bacterium]